MNDHRLPGVVVKESCEEFLADGENLRGVIWSQLAMERENELIAEFVEKIVRSN